MVVALNCNWAATAGGASAGAEVGATAEVVAAADGVGATVESGSLLEPQAVTTAAVVARTAIRLRVKTVPLDRDRYALCAHTRSGRKLFRLDFIGHHQNQFGGLNDPKQTLDVAVDLERPAFHILGSGTR